MDKITKQESSIPVQSRVSIVTLAALDNYWMGEGREIRTVSQLVSWSLYLLTEILTENDILGIEPSIEEARNYMMKRKLYQRNMDVRGYQKLGNAIKFQGMREDGCSPQQSINPQDRAAFGIMHKAPNRFSGKPSSVEPFTGKIERTLKIFTDEDFEPLPGYQEDELKAVPKVYQRPMNTSAVESTQRPTTVVKESVLKEGESIEDKMKRIEEAEKAEANTLDEFLASVREKKAKIE